MGSFNSSALRSNARPAAVSALQALAVVAAAYGLCALVWREPGPRRAVAVGLGAAWLVSSLSASAIMVAKSVSTKAFWWAFGGGMALRMLTLVALMAAVVLKPALPAPALLLSYALGVLAVLLIEYRHIKLK